MKKMGYFWIHDEDARVLFVPQSSSMLASTCDKNQYFPIFKNYNVSLFCTLGVWSPPSHWDWDESMLSPLNSKFRASVVLNRSPRFVFNCIWMQRFWENYVMKLFALLPFPLNFSLHHSSLASQIGWYYEPKITKKGL